MLSRPRKTLRVGYPSTPNCWQRSDSSVQSILASLMSFSFSVVAASSYSGARALQWPHQGAKTERSLLAMMSLHSAQGTVLNAYTLQEQYHCPSRNPQRCLSSVEQHLKQMRPPQRQVGHRPSPSRKAYQLLVDLWMRVRL